MEFWHKLETKLGDLSTGGSAAHLLDKVDPCKSVDLVRHVGQKGWRSGRGSQSSTAMTAED
jgi:hypothetical protein